MNTFNLTIREFKFDQKSFWRDPQTVFFTIGLPLLYLSSSRPSSAARRTACPVSPGR